jgi:Secretion system C-terminal sorting domain
MKKIFFLLLICNTAFTQNSNYQRSWGTYFGDERFYLQDSKADKLGNLYIVGVFVNGNSTSQPVFSNLNAYQTTFGGGESDGFIAKFNNLGQLTWATYFGGNAIDNISGLDIDGANNLYIVGATTSTTNIATSNATQTSLNGTSDFFIARFTPNGTLDWSTYYGGQNNDGNTYFLNSYYGTDNRLIISHDKENNFYIAGYTFSSDLGTFGTFQPQKEQSNQIITKFNNEGSRIWATYYNNNLGSYILALNATPAALYVRGNSNTCTNSNGNNYYGTTNGYQPIQLNCSSTFLTKFSVEGQRLWGTYYAEDNITNANSVKSYQDKVYFAGDGLGSLIATPGTFQESPGQERPSYLVQFSVDSVRDWGTFCGLNIGYPINGGSNIATNISIDDNGGLYLCGATRLHSNYATSTAFQSNLSGIQNGFICKFDNQGQKIWGTYYGGNQIEYSLTIHPYNNNNFFVVGSTSSTTGLTTPNCYQPNKLTYDTEMANNGGVVQNIFIAHFEPNPLANTPFNENVFSIYPNPSNGNFTVMLNEATFDIYTLELYDVVGKKIISQKLNTAQTIINTNNVAKGVYIAKITTKENKSYSTKLVVN